MNELDRTLLRKVDVPTYGATLQNIVPLDPRGAVMSHKQLVVVVDGDRYEPIECGLVNISLNGDTVVVDVSTVAASKQPKEEMKVGFVTSENTGDTFEMQGADLADFNLISPFRSGEHLVEDGFDPGVEQENYHAVELETAKYDIQDLTSVTAAIHDLVKKEQECIDNGNKVDTVQTPVFIYENANTFRLVEKAVLYKEQTSEG